MCIRDRAYGIQSLVGYVGGYIGMFLGLGLLQVPTLLMKAIRKIKGSNPETSTSGKRKHTIKSSNCVEEVVTKALNQSDKSQQCMACTPASYETNSKLEACELVINKVSDSLLNNKIDIMETKAEHNNCRTTTDTQMLQNRLSDLEHKVDWLCDSMHKMRNKDLIFV